MPITHAAQSGQHRRALRGNDLYETPPEAVRALLAVEKLPRLIWEPAAGRGAIVKILQKSGHEVVASDSVKHNSLRRPRILQRDFLAQTAAPAGCEAIVTNPPYMLAEQFVEHALMLCPWVCMLLRLAFLESERRSGILDGGQLAQVYVFRNRLPMMHRDGWCGPRASSAIPFAWFIWDRNHAGPTTLTRISWSK